MFRITFMCEDKHLGPVLRAVTGMAIQMEPPQPVVNATVSKSKRVSSTSLGDVSTLIVQQLNKRNGEPFKVNDLVEVRQGLGLSVEKQAAASNLYILIKKGLVDKVGKGLYQLTKET